MMPYPKDAVGLQPPNFTVDSVSYCIQCENTGNKYNFISTFHDMLKWRTTSTFLFHFTFLHKGYSGQISIECTNICKSKESIFQKEESIHDPYKQTFNIELATDAVSIYVWIEAIGKMDCLQISYFKAMTMKSLFQCVHTIQLSVCL